MADLGNEMDCDNRLEVSHYKASKPSGGYLLKADFSYGKDGRFMVKDDLLNNAWDRTINVTG